MAANLPTLVHKALTSLLAPSTNNLLSQHRRKCNIDSHLASRWAQEIKPFLSNERTSLQGELTAGEAATILARPKKVALATKSPQGLAALVGSITSWVLELTIPNRRRSLRRQSDLVSRRSSKWKTNDANKALLSGCPSVSRFQTR